MKMVVAVIRPEKLQSVKDALKAAGVNAMTITDVRGRGAQSGVKFTTRVGEFCVDEIEKVKLEIVIEDEQTESVITAIQDSAVTGHMGDGRIFVLPVERSIRIRKDE
jgi:nitrogen regulatory protein P-II 1